MTLLYGKLKQLVIIIETAHAISNEKIIPRLVRFLEVCRIAARLCLLYQGSRASTFITAESCEPPAGVEHDGSDTCFI